MTRQGSDEGRTEDEDQKYPVLSAVDRGARMTQLLEGHPVGRLTIGIVAQALLCAVSWAVAASPLCAAFLDLAPTSVGSPWAAAASLVLAYVVLSLTIGLSQRTRTAFGQDRVAGLLTSVVVCGGIASSAGAWLIASFAIEPQPVFDVHNIATSPTLPRELLALVAAAIALWAVFGLARLGPALGHARSRQEAIERLRRVGARHAGEISEVQFRNTWRMNDPIFRLQVAYDVPGERRVVLVHMRTSQARVPVVGTPMVVLTDEIGAVHVELDHSGRVEFEKDDGRYAPSEG